MSASVSPSLCEPCYGSAMTDRVGPLELAPDHGLAVGDPNGMHILLTREELLWREPGQEHDALDWEELTTIEWVVPSRRVGLIRLADAVVAVASSALDAVGVGPRDPALLRLRATTLTGDEAEWTATPHHAIGYPAADVDVVLPFLDRLHHDTALRARLAIDPRATLDELGRRR